SPDSRFHFPDITDRMTVELIRLVNVADMSGVPDRDQAELLAAADNFLDRRDEQIVFLPHQEQRRYTGRRRLQARKIRIDQLCEREPFHKLFLAHFLRLVDKSE